MEKCQQSEAACPHVLVLPLPIQGHVNSMFKLAELLALSGFKVTFLNSEHNHERLVKYTNITAHFARYPGFEFKTIPDGLPDDHPRTGEWFLEMFDAMEMKTKSSLIEMLLNISPPVDCIIGDGFLGFALDAANELGIPIIYFRTSSACCFWVYYSIPDMIQAGELPTREMDRLITTVPGMETFLRCRDLPSFCRASNMTDADSKIQLIVKETRKTPQAHSLILNTFEDLDGPILSHIRTKCPHIYAIGPIHAQLNTRLREKYGESYDHFSNSLWELDRSCISWLDKQPKQCVIYVSFGSVTTTSREQLTELWYGLVNSKKRFLWVIRPNSVTGKDGRGGDVPVELLEATRERGYIVGWAPQEEVLNHPAVGGFLTHSGWNSTLESVVAGVPMICWPYFADQQVNSRFVSEAWKIGLDMKDVCDRKVVEMMVNDLMVNRKEEFVKPAAKMAKLANESVSVGGSSYCNLDRLIEDIRLMSLKKL
ncbi:LOW QUALITY PROTEIN: 7-deoxyloganetic acid glucosyltransferase-like [Durio zibethinus]|uniref:Glycosyltransferase n=1 Tax=Durio zibethinus TaxID=66656 RepID=A0A6P5YY85_DURZI|nr:LOW QUALITY PROTEIN: 7-deoxyloganetic acid glucosyltransferase-like [Durio zibethinus]